MAGIWSKWHQPNNNEAVTTCAIVTTHANAAVQALHDRMPVILQPQDYATWLNSNAHQEELQGLFMPYNGSLEIHAVTTEVNKVAFNSKACIARKKLINR